MSCKVSVDRRKLHVFCRPNCRGTCTLCNSRRADPLLRCRVRVLNDTVFYIKQTLHRQIAIFCAMISIKLQRNYNQVVCIHKNIMPTIYIRIFTYAIFKFTTSSCTELRWKLATPQHFKLSRVLTHSLKLYVPTTRVN